GGRPFYADRGPGDAVVTRIDHPPLEATGGHARGVGRGFCLIRRSRVQLRGLYRRELLTSRQRRRLQRLHPLRLGQLLGVLCQLVNRLVRRDRPPSTERGVT